MYLTHIKSLAVKAMRLTLDADYPESDFRNVPVEINYPTRPTDFPSVWVDFDPIGFLRPVGVGHVEDSIVDGGFSRVVRWSYAGNITYTACAMTSLERDRLFDQLVSVVAFGLVDEERGQFRRIFETDELIQVVMNFDEIDQRGFSAAPGTPWGTEEMMYEATIGLQVQGEFVSSPSGDPLLPISTIEVVSWVSELESDPDPTGDWLS